MYSILYSPRAALYNYCIVGVLSCVIMAVNITCTLWTEHSKLWMCPLISPILTAPICYSTNTNRTMKWMLKSKEKTNEHIIASRAVLCYYCSQLAAENIRESRNKLIIFSRKASNQAHLSILCVLSCIVWHSESERSRRLHWWLRAQSEGGLHFSSQIEQKVRVPNEYQLHKTSQSIHN